MWQPASLRVSDLPAFVRQSIEKGVFVPGDSDLIIRDPAGTVEFMLCHESDLHLSSGNDKLTERVNEEWREKGTDRKSVV